MRVKPKDIIQMYYCCWEDVEKTAEALGINRSTVYRWIGRARIWGRVTHWQLKRHSTRPNHIYYSLTPNEESAILKLRAKRGHTAEKIKHILKLSACSLTIHRLLRRERLVNRYGNHRRPYYQETTHMHVKNTSTVGYLQMDVKYITPELSGLPWTCFEYAVVDIYSRYKAAVILNQLDEDGSIQALLEIIPKLPFKPLFIQTDNGLEFQGRFLRYVKGMGLTHHYVHKRTPNENAVVERSFRTDEEEFFFRIEKPPTHYDELKVLFSEYLKYYNEERPHFGIDLKTPLEVIKAGVANVMLD